MNSIHVIGIILSLGLISTDEPEISSSDSCAIPALYHVLKFYKHNSHLSARDVIEAFPDQPENGFSLNDMIKVARQFNIDLEGFYLKSPPSKILEPLIVFTEGKHGHYISLLPVGKTGERAILIDGYKFPKIVNMKFILQNYGWSGRVLKRGGGNQWPFMLYCVTIFCTSAFIWRRSLTISKDIN